MQLLKQVRTIRLSNFDAPEEVYEISANEMQIHDSKTLIVGGENWALEKC